MRTIQVDVLPADGLHAVRGHGLGHRDDLGLVADVVRRVGVWLERLGAVPVCSAARPRQSGLERSSVRAEQSVSRGVQRLSQVHHVFHPNGGTLETPLSYACADERSSASGSRRRSGMPELKLAAISRRRNQLAAKERAAVCGCGPGLWPGTGQTRVQVKAGLWWVFCRSSVGTCRVLVCPRAGFALLSADLPAADEGARRRRCGARVSEKRRPHTPHNGAMAKAIDKWKGFDQG